MLISIGIFENLWKANPKRFRNQDNKIEKEEEKEEANLMMAIPDTKMEKETIDKMIDSSEKELLLKLTKTLTTTSIILDHGLSKRELRLP